MKLFTKTFTLIELLIVIVIIGVLATALIPRLKGMQDKARYVRVEKDFADFKTAVFMAQNNTNKRLKDITDSGFTAGYCTSLSPNYTFFSDMRNLDYDDSCRARFRLSLQKIAVAASMLSGGLTHLELDPWGSPYVLDENEGEGGAANCSRDNFRSVGPDGKIRTSDDRYILLAPSYCPGAY